MTTNYNHILARLPYAWSKRLRYSILLPSTNPLTNHSKNCWIPLHKKSTYRVPRTKFTLTNLDLNVISISTGNANPGSQSRRATRKTGRHGCPLPTTHGHRPHLTFSPGTSYVAERGYNRSSII